MMLNDTLCEYAKRRASITAEDPEYIKYALSEGIRRRSALILDCAGIPQIERFAFMNDQEAEIAVTEYCNNTGR